MSPNSPVPGIARGAIPGPTSLAWALLMRSGPVPWDFIRFVALSDLFAANSVV